MLCSSFRAEIFIEVSSYRAGGNASNRASEKESPLEELDVDDEAEDDSGAEDPDDDEEIALVEHVAST